MRVCANYNKGLGLIADLKQELEKVKKERNYLRGFLEKKQSLQNAKQSLENSTAELGAEITNFLAHGTV